MICDKCGKEIIGKNAGAHKRWCGHTKGSKLKITTCMICGKTIKSKRGRTTCSNECLSQVMSQPEIRQKMSKSRKKFLCENPDKHPWKRPDKKKSAPCERFKTALREANIDFHEEFSPVPDRFFSIDVAFPAIQVGIEINGEQHYNRDKTLRKYYQQRHDLIEAAGWSLYEIHYSIVFNNEKMKNVIDTIAKTHSLDDVDLTFELKKKDKGKLKNKIKSDAREKLKQKRKARYEEYHFVIKKSNPYKFGWLSRASRKLGVSHTQIRRFVNQHIPDNNFYQRKSRISACSSSG